MRIANYLLSTSVEGPGERFAVWLQGCSILCEDCCNPEMIDFKKGYEIAPQILARKASSQNNDGITILGGEPLDQVEQLKKFIVEFKKLSSKSIMLFSGYTWEQINSCDNKKEIAQLCDLVIAGKYMKQLPENSRQWIGSQNQTIHFITNKLSKLKTKWPKLKKEIEISIIDGKIILNGSVLGKEHELEQILTRKAK